MYATKIQWRIQVILCFVLLITQNGFSQKRITVIDSSATTGYLFDNKNPQSLISLVKNNRMVFRSMDYTTSEDLLSFGVLKSEVYKRGKQSDIPLANSYGEDSMITINGYTQFVYPPADQFYVDLHQITRFIIVENKTSENSNNYQIEEIILAKKYPGMKQYVLVGSIPFDQFINGNKYIYFEQMESETLNTLLNDKNQLWNRWSTDCIKTFDNEDFDYYVEIPGLTWNSKFHPNYYFSTFDELQPDMVEVRGYWFQNYNWPFTISSADNYLEDMQKAFGTSKIEGREWPQSNYPLINVFGEDSVVIIDGETQFVYPEQEFTPYWIDAKPDKAWKIYAINHNNGQPKKELRRIVFTIKENGQDVILADYDCKQSEEHLEYTHMLENLKISFETSLETDWMQNLQSEKEKGQTFLLERKSDVKKLNKIYFELKLLGLGDFGYYGYVLLDEY